MLVAAAAKKWGVDAKDISVADGVVSSGNHKATFGELAPAASKAGVPKDVVLKDPAKFKIVGKKADRLDNSDLVRGKSNYGIGRTFGVFLDLFLLSFFVHYMDRPLRAFGQLRRIA